MGLEEILKNTEAEAEEKANAIISKAKDEAENIRRKADEKAKEISEEYVLKSDREAKQIIARERSRANIEAKAVIQESIDAELAKAYSSLEDSIDKFIRSDSYAKLLSKLAKDAYRLLGSGSTIAVASGDEKKFKAPAGCTVKADESIKGGMMAYSKDGKRYVDYTIDRIIERVRGRLVKKYTELIK
ncbi:MAG: V-type ATP synthase subunit E [Candidatus Micrarchaeia archaeon]